jgi:8-amino-7-oxononanoate synthase
LQQRPELRQQLWRNAKSLYEGLAGLGLTLGPDVSPVVGVRFADRDQALGVWHQLLDAGVYTNLIAPPASPDGSSLLRVSTSAAHTPAQIDEIVTAFSVVLTGQNKFG